MFQSKAHDRYRGKVAVDWMLLASAAGMVNAGGLLSCHRFVTHVTGFATLSGVELVGGNVAEAAGMLTVPLFFLSGAIVAALLVERPIQRDMRPHYTTVMFLITAALVAAALLGHAGAFGPFGGASEIGRDYLLMALLCGASGLQNSVISLSSGATVRLTHLTGLTTDLGSGLVRLMTSDDFTVRKMERKATLLRAGTIASFIVGGALGAAIFARYQYLGFLAPAAIGVYAMVLASRHRQRLLAFYR